MTVPQLAALTLTCAAVAFAPTRADAQYGETLRGGRPGQAMGVYAVGDKVLQFEQGVTFQKTDFNTGQIDGNSITNNNVIRLGLAERLEVSTVVVVQRTAVDIEGFTPGDDEFRETGISVRQVRGRVALSNGEDFLPPIALQVAALLPWSSSVFNRDNLGFTAQVSGGDSVNDWLALTGNVGVTNSGNGLDTDGFYVGAVGFSVSENLGLLVEGYGRFREFDFNVDFGASYHVNDDLQLDVLYGRQGFGQFEGDLPAIDDQWFLSAGVSWRVTWREAGQ